MLILLYIQSGWTPLLSACAGGHSDVAQLLINKGASVDVMNEVSNCNKATFFFTKLDLFHFPVQYGFINVLVFIDSYVYYVFHAEWTHTFVSCLCWRSQ